MSDYLTNLAFRALHPSGTLQPRRPGMFEPEPPDLMGMPENLAGSGHAAGENPFMDEMRTAPALRGMEPDLLRAAGLRPDESTGPEQGSPLEHRGAPPHLAPRRERSMNEMRGDTDSRQALMRLRADDPVKGNADDDIRHGVAPRMNNAQRENNQMPHRVPGRMALQGDGDRAARRESLMPRESARLHAEEVAGHTTLNEPKPAIDAGLRAPEPGPGGSLGHAFMEPVPERELAAVHMPARPDASAAMQARRDDAGRKVMSDEQSEPSVIRVTIGRIDVRAVMPKESSSPSTPARQSAPRLSLEEYLGARKRRER